MDQAINTFLGCVEVSQCWPISKNVVPCFRHPLVLKDLNQGERGETTVLALGPLILSAEISASSQTNHVANKANNDKRSGLEVSDFWAVGFAVRILHRQLERDVLRRSSDSSMDVFK